MGQCKRLGAESVYTTFFLLTKREDDPPHEKVVIRRRRQPKPFHVHRIENQAVCGNSRSITKAVGRTSVKRGR